MRGVLLRASQNVVRPERALEGAHAFVYVAGSSAGDGAAHKITNRIASRAVPALFAAALITAAHLSDQARATLPRTHPAPSTAPPSMLAAFENVVRTRAPRPSPLRPRQLRLVRCCSDAQGGYDDDRCSHARKTVDLFLAPMNESSAQTNICMYRDDDDLHLCVQLRPFSSAHATNPFDSTLHARTAHPNGTTKASRSPMPIVFPAHARQALSVLHHLVPGIVLTLAVELDAAEEKRTFVRCRRRSRWRSEQERDRLPGQSRWRGSELDAWYETLHEDGLGHVDEHYSLSALCSPPG
ncbi:hypothetical protein C8R45DRAFT_1183517 [Mycena sanguinolenta]|nr:hypothetical protein C8R45DRAFT_1183517 [Mycena sanguinolenta]